MKCDGTGCLKEPIYGCDCRRCQREDVNERYHACKEHLYDVKAKHERVRGREFDAYLL